MCVKTSAFTKPILRESEGKNKKKKNNFIQADSLQCTLLYNIKYKMQNRKEEGGKKKEEERTQNIERRILNNTFCLSLFVCVYYTAKNYWRKRLLFANNWKIAISTLYKTTCPRDEQTSEQRNLNHVRQTTCRECFELFIWQSSRWKNDHWPSGDLYEKLNWTKKATTTTTNTQMMRERLAEQCNTTKKKAKKRKKRKELNAYAIIKVCMQHSQQHIATVLYSLIVL